MMRLVLPILAAALAVAATPAAAAEGEWAAGVKASVRLVAAGVGTDGRLAGGIEVVMPVGWHTYWRTPGDAGIAPSFDFSASKNVADVAVDFPVPTRLDDGFSVTNVYFDRVVFPFSATVLDATQPIALELAVLLGVCSEICVPDSVTAMVAVPPGENDESTTAFLADARAWLPASPDPDFAVLAVERVGGTDRRPVFRVSARVPDGESADVFVEGPGDWSAYLPVRSAGTDAGEVTWAVKFSRLGATGPVDGVAFRVTLVSAGRAVEQTITAN